MEWSRRNQEGYSDELKEAIKIVLGSDENERISKKVRVEKIPSSNRLVGSKWT